MKSKKIICVLVVFLIIIFTINLKSYAFLPPRLMITSNNYLIGDKMQYDDVKDVEVEKTLQLYAVIAHGNEMLNDNNDEENTGMFVDENNLSETTWSSSNTNVATVDNTGKVTGIAEGKTTISVSHNNESSTYEVNVKQKSNEEDTGIMFGRYEPEPAKILNKDYGFWIYLNNIPDTEKEKIEVSIEDEKIAKLAGIDLCEWEDGSGKGIIIANTKLLAVGKTKITATLNYNGKTYSDTIDFDVIESVYSLSLSAKEYTDLPSKIEVGDKIQLITMLHTYGGSLLPQDVTSKGVTYTSSDEKIAKVDNKGLITANEEGTVIITAKYKAEDETVIAKYNLLITDSTKSPSNPGTNKPKKTDNPTTLPKTGKNTIIVFIGVVLVLFISLIMYKNYKNYKNIK